MLDKALNFLRLVLAVVFGLPAALTVGYVLFFWLYAGYQFVDTFAKTPKESLYFIMVYLILSGIGLSLLSYTLFWIYLHTKYAITALHGRLFSVGESIPSSTSNPSQNITGGEHTAPTPLPTPQISAYAIGEAVKNYFLMEKISDYSPDDFSNRVKPILYLLKEQLGWIPDGKNQKEDSNILNNILLNTEFFEMKPGKKGQRIWLKLEYRIEPREDNRIHQEPSEYTKIKEGYTKRGIASVWTKDFDKEERKEFLKTPEGQAILNAKVTEEATA